MHREDAEALRHLVQSRSGVIIDPSKTYLVETRLGPLARREGYPSYAELIAAMRANRDDRLIWAITEAMTCGESSFFRDRAVFDHVHGAILPRFAGRRASPVRIWSAACAAGQEPYSLAMTIFDQLHALEGAQIELYGSDLSEAALEKARSGLYTQFEVQRGLPIRQLLRHFDKQGEMWRVKPQIAQMVRWRRINVLADLTPLGRFDMIFCRYLLNSFDPAMRRRVLEQLKGLIGEDGFLVLGADEDASDVDGLYAVSDAPGLYARRPDRHAAAA